MLDSGIDIACDTDWLVDYDNVYEMFLGDFGIDITKFDPYDCTTWYT